MTLLCRVLLFPARTSTEYVHAALEECTNNVISPDEELRILLTSKERVRLYDQQCDTPVSYDRIGTHQERPCGCHTSLRGEEKLSPKEWHTSSG